ncbi:hypothetical protein SEA_CHARGERPOWER_79 [Mycobacterium phage Chargerpower]|nr:hypothetical protein SEA_CHARGERPOWER_79 [Mycobacterium phage Chargerpower]
MRAMLTIENVMLEPKVRVTLVNPGSDDPVEAYSIDTEDAEYQLLAQAIDRFQTVLQLRNGR